MDPALHDAGLKRGLAYFSFGQLEAAIADFGAVLAADPKASDADLDRWLAFAAGGDLTRAKAASHGIC